MHARPRLMSRRQPQRAPPPLTYGAEILDGEATLWELTGDLALFLWKTSRTVRLWSELGPEERTEAFTEGAYAERLTQLRGLRLEPDLLQALEGAAAVLQRGDVDPSEVAAACVRVTEWAEQQGALGTALEFMQAAALVLPVDASLARATARLARRHAEYARAETWFRQSITVAKQTQAWEVLARSYMGLGITYMQRGNYPAARSSLLRGLRAAQRHSVHEVVGMAYHDLAALAARASRPREVAKFARAALEAYGPGHPRLPWLAHDVAASWMDQGHFATALQVFASIPPDVGGHAEQLARAACLVRSAAAVGDRETYRSAWRTGTKLLRLPSTAQIAATALISMARGAASAGDWARAETAAEQARQLAVARGEQEQRMEAESLLETLRHSRQQLQPESAEGVSPPGNVERLAGDLAAAVATAAGSL